MTSLHNQADKLAIIRDICLAVGITLDFGSKSQQINDSKELVLDNDPQAMRELISKNVHK